MPLLNRHRKRSASNSSTSLATGRQPSPEEWEEADLSSTEYARRRKELMQLISDLRSMGAQTLIDIPSIVVIGGQSAGKSSLVEAVSGVNVPRDSGTCTRCPVECTMSSSATTWSCQIKLRFDYDSFGHSAVQQREIAFGPTITNKSEVDVWLRRAQTAILNPSVLPETFYRKSAQELKNFTSSSSLKFSRNVVSIFIEDPHATDLSFVDLPGLIQNEETSVLDLVRELAEDYIRRPNTIILTTIPMTDDMENQQSVRLAREADPDGERTIGVLTKPDMLGPGAVNARKLWVDVLEGRQHRLEHGYYCVRLPDDAQRAQGLSRSELQRIAAEYFDNTSPWKDITDHGRFGIPAFVSDISVLLVEHINRVLPQLRQDVERLLASCLVEIGTLPALLQTDPQIEVLARVNEFSDAFKGAVSGTSLDKSLAQRNQALYTIFAQQIRGTSPDFRPFEQPKQYRRIDPFESEEDVVANTKGKIMGVFEVLKIIKESTAWELPGNIPYAAKTRLINEFTNLWISPAENCLTSINDVLDDVIRRLVKTHFGRFKVLHDLISDLIHLDIEEHKVKTLIAIRETLKLETSPAYTQNTNDFQNLRAKWLAKYRHARHNSEEYEIHEVKEVKTYSGKVPCSLEPPARETLCVPTPEPISFGRGLKKTNKNKVREAKEIETYFEGVPSSLETPACEAPCLPMMISLSPAPQPPSVNVPQVKAQSISPVDQALRYLAQAGYTGLTIDDLTRLAPRDEQFDDELTVMADVRAYFTIACKRIIDHVPLKIEHSLHHALVDRLSVGLLQRLMTDAISTGNFVDRMKELVSEDPETERRRARLEAKRTRLQEMRKKLVNFAA